MLIKICTKPSVTKSYLFLHTTQCCAAAGEMLNILSIKIPMLGTADFFTNRSLYVCVCVRQIYYDILGGFHYLLVSSSYYPLVPNTMYLKCPVEC